MNKIARNILLAIATIVPVGNALAQIPEGYYDALKGKRGAELKTAVHNIIKTAKVLNYGSGENSTWWGFYLTDNDNGYVIDRYSNKSVKFDSRGAVPSGMNIEHSFPKSWWGGSKNQAYQDLYNLMPSDSKANSSKGNYGMGVVTQTSGKGFYDNECIKVGDGSEGFKVWQPSKQWEGDFARGYMYMATAYQDFTWQGEAALNSLQQGDYPTLKPWAYKLYIKWAKEDQVDETETKRNEAVYKIQGNRNPFIDFPNLMEYIWGDSIDYAFDPATTMKSTKYNGGSGEVTPGETGTVIYSADYHSAGGDCETTDVKQPQNGIEIWQRSSNYGWKATSSIKNSSGKYDKYKGEGTLALPEIDLGGYSSASLSFTHMLNFCTSPDDYLSVEVHCDGNVTKLTGFTWPAGTKFVSVKSGDISLNQFVGKKIQIVFHYTGTTSVSATWEIEKATVTGKKTSTGIDAVSFTSQFDPAKPYEAFDISGHRLSREGAGRGVVIIRQGGKAFKMVKK